MDGGGGGVGVGGGYGKLGMIGYCICRTSGDEDGSFLSLGSVVSDGDGGSEFLA